MSLPSFLYSQIFVGLPVPDHDFTGQTIVITGGSTGLGLEAARHFLRLNASHIVLGVRNMEKGKGAKKDLETSTNRPNTVRLEHIDMDRYDSVKNFASVIQNTVPKVDVLLLNAGKIAENFYLAEEDESTITVNVVCTVFLGLLLLPKLRDSASPNGPIPRLCFVASDRHVMTNLPEWKTEDTFAALRAQTESGADDRYYASKLLNVLMFRQLAEEITSCTPRVAVNGFTPGYCATALIRETQGFWGWQLYVMKLTIARTIEVGSRTLVHAASLGWEGHGKYLNDCKIDDGALSSFVRSDEGKQAQVKVWKELLEKLDRIAPGISENLAN
ncbi:NAD(P)-binding protein [Aspergillus ruber CBS 135680]|uniref:NAD(P)-binding protein n=1 Tax=Aspergillus ruber (strain CBS 135680) TaxID=1388766 RepID=A0A017S425_ASPRC|nr:NAD(P)-binding protein [Aspergillus ruber CBS 135680]EYE91702.1 NAD(P)-binding protein [Aspergillus ruber CBS 135680]